MWSNIYVAGGIVGLMADIIEFFFYLWQPTGNSGNLGQPASAHTRHETPYPQ
jgi:hypothetical protein